MTDFLREIEDLLLHEARMSTPDPFADLSISLPPEDRVFLRKLGTGVSMEVYARAGCVNVTIGELLLTFKVSAVLPCPVPWSAVEQSIATAPLYANGATAEKAYTNLIETVKVKIEGLSAVLATLRSGCERVVAAATATPVRLAHVWERHQDHEPDSQECRMVCSGGLALCTVCCGAEGTLTTDCCGERMTIEQCNAVYDATLDFVGGAWVKKNESS